eukprot:TRINITY_DN25436_c0_g6_i1.p1 TRINITY_DN25436_c0_g6~~TRINITY_DN25436_c0_g6_i1.p1  ORF type:complete len:693 (+),score=118.43 TRINITY_DN25436_c0_g6_i1:52-2079(+)
MAVAPTPAVQTGYKQLPTHDEYYVPSDEEPENGGWQSCRSQNAFETNGVRVDNDHLASGLEPGDRSSVCYFVETWWFHLIAAAIIIFNTVLIVMETDNKDLAEDMYWVDQAILTFYVFELLARVFLWKCRILFGPTHVVMWSFLDFLVVGAAVLDQWVLPYLHITPIGTVNKLLEFSRLLRMLRVFKVIGFVLDWDLSWTEDARFQSFIGGVIAFNAVLMGCETDFVWGGWIIIENILLCIYVFELLVRLKRMRMYFFSCDNPDIIWNLLDMVIVVSSAGDSWVMAIVEVARSTLSDEAKGSGHEKAKATGMNLGQVMMLMRLLRLLRILRLAKLVKSIRPLYILVASVTAAVQGVVWVLVLTIVTLYAMGILTTRLIGHKMLFKDDYVDEEIIAPFKTVGDSMFTLFRVMSGAESDAEAQAIDSIMAALPILKFWFVFFMVTSSWTLLSILTAVVSENMISTTGNQEKELLLCSAEEDRQEHIKALKELFGVIDTKGDGFVREDDVREFLKDKNRAMQTAKMCRVPVRDVVEVMKTLGRNSDQVIKMETFVECLLDVGTPVTEKSVMKLEALHLEAQLLIQRNHEDIIENQTQAQHVLDHLSEANQTHAQSLQLLKGLTETSQCQDQAITGLHKSVQDLTHKLDYITSLLTQDACNGHIGCNGNDAQVESHKFH